MIAVAQKGPLKDLNASAFELGWWYILFRLEGIGLNWLMKWKSPNVICIN